MRRYCNGILVFFNYSHLTEIPAERFDQAISIVPAARSLIVIALFLRFCFGQTVSFAIPLRLVLKRRTDIRFGYAFGN